MKIQTFIFVHDQNIVLDFEANQKFSNVENLKYVFLGSRDIDKIKDRKDIIIARELEGNIEEHNIRFLSFSGWYILWKHNLITADYVNLFEYDINLSEKFNSSVNNVINDGAKVIGYINYDLMYHWIWNPVEIYMPLFVSMLKRHNINGADFINSQPKGQICSMTSNHTFERETFKKYMTWMEPMIEDLQNEYYAGHHTERSIMIWYLMFIKESVYIISDVLEHFQLDTHKTQGFGEDKFTNNYDNLIKNGEK